MSMIYLKDETAQRLKAAATYQRRTISSVVEIMLDFDDQRVFAEQARLEKEKKAEVRKNGI